MTAVGEGFAASLASEASKGLFLLAKRHAGYCFHFKRYVEEFQTKLKNLESTENDALERERSAKENNEEITDVAKNWLGKAKDLIDAAEELKKKIEKPSMCAIGWCPNCIRRHGLGKKAAEIILELNKHNIDFKSDHFSRPAPPLGMEFHAHINFIDLESRKVAYDELWMALQDEEKMRIGVYAMGGSGKTTLVKELGYKAEKEKLFHKVAFVIVSNTLDVRRIQENIASQLGLTFRFSQESDRAKELWSRMTNGDKILIIFDDVWEKLDFKYIGIPFDEKHKSCKVLFTTRSVGVCTSMECQLNIQLSVLTEEDSWKLFQKYANINNDPSVPLYVAKEIARECKGLPVAIASLASTLKDNEPQEWEYALSTLKNSEPLIGIDEHLIEIYSCLRLSYANLKSREAQELFLLCSFFPEDDEIPVEDLTRYAIGLHLFGHDCSIMKARRLTLKAKKTLTDSCLLLNVESGEECVKMHDLIREVAQWIANKEIKEITGSKIDEDALDRTRYLWFHVNNDLLNQLNYPKLEVLMISVEIGQNISLKMKEGFFRGLHNLRVFILKMTLRLVSIKLPQSIQFLKGLRILCLDGLKLSNISIIGSLKSLESFELRNCEIDELPSEMVELNNLRLLDLSNCTILQNPFEVIGRFMQLEELYYFTEFLSVGWKIDGENISNFFGENCRLTNLARYRIQIGNLDDKLGEQLIPRGLSIDCFHPFTSNATLKSLVRRAEYLSLNKIKGGYKNIVPDVVQAVGGKIQWTKLRVRSCVDIECLIDASNVSSQDAGMLTALIELQVSSMDNLKEVCRGTPPSGFLEKLEKLHVDSCNQLHSILFVGRLNLRNLKAVEVRHCLMLTSLFTLSVALSLELLEKLYVYSCSGLKYIIADERGCEKDVFNQEISYTSIFSKLKSLVILNCENLEFIFPVCLARRLVLLEEIQIKDAAKLKYIFGQFQDEGGSLHKNDKEIMLPSLQKIILWDIPNFNSIFPMHCHLKDFPEMEATRLEATTPKALHSSQNHDTTWYTSAVQCLPRKLLVHCFQMEATALDTTTSKDASILSTSVELKVSLMDNLKELCDSTPPSGILEKLEKLIVIGCYQLRSISFGGNLNLCSLKDVKVESCSVLTSLFTVSVALSLVQLEKLHISACKGLEYIIADEKEWKNDNYNAKISSGSIFQKLKSVEIDECESLEFIFPVCLAGKLVRLELIRIKCAAKLKHIFGEFQNEGKGKPFLQNGEMMLPSLEKIVMNEIPNFNSIFPMYCNPKDCTEVEAISLEATTTMELQTTRLIPYASSVQYCLSRQLLNMCHIREMYLISLPTTVVSLFSLSTAQNMLLEQLIVRECHGLKHIITDVEEVDFEHMSYDSILPELRNLDIEECNLLEFILPACFAHCASNLMYLRINKGLELKSVFGQCYHLSHQDGNVIHMKHLALKELRLWDCPKLSTCKFINDFMICSDAREPDFITTKAILRKGFNLETVKILEVKGCPIFFPEHRNKGDEVLPQLSTSVTLLPIAPSNLPEYPNIVEGKEAKQEEKPTTFADNQKPDMLVVQPREVEETDERSYKFSIGTVHSGTNQTTLQRNERRTIRVKRSVRNRKGEIAQKGFALEKPGMELVDEQKQLLSVPILMDQQRNALAVTEITTEIQEKITNAASSEIIGGKVQREKNEMATSSSDSETGSLLSEGEITVSQTETSRVLAITTSLNPNEYQNAGDSPKEPFTLGSQYNATLIKETKEEVVTEHITTCAEIPLSRHFTSGTSGETPKQLYLSAAPQSIHMNEKIQESSSNPLVDLPSTSSKFPSGDAQDVSSSTQHNVTPVEVEREMAINQDASPQTFIEDDINMNKNLHGGNPLEDPPSRDSTSGTSGEAPKELSTSVTVPPIASSTSLLLSISLPPIGASPSEVEPQSSYAAQQIITPVEEYAAFRDIGVIKKKHIPLLEQAMANHPSLWDWHKRYKRSQMKHLGYTILGDMLEFLASTRWRDLTQEKKAEFESLVDEIEMFRFDIQWLDSTRAMIKQSKIDEETINQMKTLEVKEAEQQNELEVLEACLHKVKMELSITKSQLLNIRSELGNLDNFLGFRPFV
ncbi:hypothetical protein L6164_031563 [Bauhinia variegata]|uniref:Uncharacterized protein n=1 Tax=Bauhinia variegata TaxID=167791 RepID=A0ACB9LFV0_BAUVA|nr:hypothetical protein L6164_031563 [Bauhinia variegata]